MIIAEIGINHNGNVELAKELILMAKRCGADMVKFQKRSVEENIGSRDRGTIRNTPFGKVPYEAYKHGLELGFTDYSTIDRICADIGILWTASAWDIPSVNFISKFNVPFIKIPSARVNEIEFLRAVNDTGLPVIMSIGMSDLSEIDQAVEVLEGLETIMYCKSIYPSSPELLNLKGITTLKHRYPWLKIGYSSHDLTMIPAIAATALGAEVFEFHITLNRNMFGSDQNISWQEQEFSNMIFSLRECEKALGSSLISCLTEELPAKEKLRRYPR